MHKRLFYLLPLALLLWGCPTNDEETPEPEKSCLLQSAEGDFFSQHFTYNGQEQLTHIAVDSAGTPFWNLNLTYDAKQRLTKIEGSGLLVTNEYNEQDQLIKRTRYYNVATASPYIYTFSYNNKKELEEVRTYYADSGSERLLGTRSYTYTNGNPTLIVERSAAGEMNTQTVLTYDDKKSPLHFRALDFNLETGTSLNNIVSYQQTDRIGGIRGYTVSYTYNAQGLPVVATNTYTGGDKWTTTYSYDCR